MENIPSSRELFDVNGKVAIVTGATGAFGAAAAMGLAKAGAKVMCTGRKVETLAPLRVGTLENMQINESK